MWLFATEKPTGAHRGLFFKGDVERLGGQRTPSAWLGPDSHKVALRVSTAFGLDIGADTEFPVPEKRWTHLLFGFRNLSAAPATRADGRNATFVYSLDVDGARDSTLDIFDEVVWNDGPLRLLRDPDRPGVRGYAADVEILAAAPDRAGAARHYARRRAVFAAPEPFVAAPPEKAPPIDADLALAAVDPWAAAVAATEECAPFLERVALYFRRVGIP